MLKRERERVGKIHNLQPSLLSRLIIWGTNNSRLHWNRLRTVYICSDCKYMNTFFLGMWSSKEMKISQDPEIVVRTTIRELIVYMLFLLNLCICKYHFSKGQSYSTNCCVRYGGYLNTVLSLNFFFFFFFF